MVVRYERSSFLALAEKVKYRISQDVKQFFSRTEQHKYLPCNGSAIVCYIALC